MPHPVASSRAICVRQASQFLAATSYVRLIVEYSSGKAPMQRAQESLWPHFAGLGWRFRSGTGVDFLRKAVGGTFWLAEADQGRQIRLFHLTRPKQMLQESMVGKEKCGVRR